MKDQAKHPLDIWPPPPKKKLSKGEKRRQTLKPSADFVDPSETEDADFLVYDADTNESLTPPQTETREVEEKTTKR